MCNEFLNNLKHYSYFRNSFIPSAIKSWNKTLQKNRNLEHFKDSLKLTHNFLYYIGARLVNISHTQLCMNCSNLNVHLFQLHVVDSPDCSHGYNLEDVSHFLFYCPLYHEIWTKMNDKLYNLFTANNILIVDMVVDESHHLMVLLRFHLK